MTYALRFFTGALAAGFLVVVTHPAFAVSAYPKKASRYTAGMARAMDQCDPPTSVVTSAGDPSAGCRQANTVTDDGSVPPGATMKNAKVVVSKTGGAHHGKVKLTGAGFLTGQRIQVCLTVRTTKHATLQIAGANQSVTFEDVTFCCGTQTYSCLNGIGTKTFVARPNGSVAGYVDLDQCLTDNGLATGLAHGNVQVLDSNLTNCDTGKVIATPGILN
jgi:hypothetical protein